MNLISHQTRFCPYVIMLCAASRAGLTFLPIVKTSLNWGLDVNQSQWELSENRVWESGAWGTFGILYFSLHAILVTLLGAALKWIPKFPWRLCNAFVMLLFFIWLGSVMWYMHNEFLNWLVKKGSDFHWHSAIVVWLLILGFALLWSIDVRKRRKSTPKKNTFVTLSFLALVDFIWMGFNGIYFQFIEEGASLTPYALALAVAQTTLIIALVKTAAAGRLDREQEMGGDLAS